MALPNENRCNWQQSIFSLQICITWFVTVKDFDGIISNISHCITEAYLSSVKH